MCVCLSVGSYSGTTGYEAANEIYQHVHNYVSQNGDLHETTALERYATKKAKRPMHNYACLPLPDPPCVCTLEAQEGTMKSVYLLPHAICNRKPY